ncbi:MAG: hypothetical protein AB2531_01845, partial [Candidatus Thiodiazotropha sp.]
LPELAEGMVTAAHESADNDQSMEPLKRVSRQSETPAVRCGVALFAAANRIQQADQWMQRLRIDKAGRQLLKDLLHFHRLALTATQSESLLRFVTALNPQQQPARFRHFVEAAGGLWPQRMGELQPYLQAAAEILAAPLPEELVDAGLAGKALGDALFAWRVVRLQEVASRLETSN